jgi:cell division protein ZipA
LAAELRWILLGLSLPLLAFIWWWTARRAGQTPGNAELRESPPAHEESARAAAEPRDWGVPPFEPLNIRTADFDIRTAEFDRVPVLDGPMMVHPEPQAARSTAMAHPPMVARAPAVTHPPAMAHAPAMAHSPAEAHTPAAAPVLPVAPAPNAGRDPKSTTGPVADNSDRFAAPSAPPANAAELQRIVTVRVCAVGETRWSGPQLMAALELHGLAFGRYQVFHRKHVDGRSLFCAASLIEPGTFDMAVMGSQEFRGVTLFAVLPGPTVPLDTVDELLRTARGLAEELSGMIQDAKGMPMSPQRAASLREEVAQFQASLSGR